MGVDRATPFTSCSVRATTHPGRNSGEFRYTSGHEPQVEPVGVVQRVAALAEEHGQADANGVC